MGKRLHRSLYGRRKGPALSPRRADLLKNLLPRLGVDTTAPPPADVSALFSKSYSAYRLEIGFGGGEHLIDQASRHPDLGFFGVEPFINGMAKALSAIEAGGIDNIRLYDGDGADLLDWLPAGSIDRVDLLYPDPWPKRRHWKRRFVNSVRLAAIGRVLRPGGEFRFASDDASYVNWTLAHCWKDENLAWTATHADDWRKPWPDWPGTRYEAKALREGRTPAYLTFVRI